MALYGMPLYPVKDSSNKDVRIMYYHSSKPTQPTPLRHHLCLHGMSWIFIGADWRLRWWPVRIPWQDPNGVLQVASHPQNLLQD